jgi:tRNA threonylcarbamoyladenosine biosynthesis protein TsaB
MLTLAIDTASRSCSVAVADGDTLLAEINDASGETHSRHLMAMVDQAVAMSVKHIRAIEGYAVTRGPGSFTGLRIGIGAAKGLAEAAGRPLVGVSSLEALAWQAARTDAIILPMLDARRKEVYAARYIHRDGALKPLGAERALPPEDAVAGLAEPCLLVGDGALAYEVRLRAALGAHMQLALPSQHVIRASTVAFLAREGLTGALDERMTLTPHYLRPSYADQQRHPISG